MPQGWKCLDRLNLLIKIGRIQCVNKYFVIFYAISCSFIYFLDFLSNVKVTLLKDYKFKETKT